MSSLHVSIYLLINERLVLMKYMTPIFNLRRPKSKLSNIWGIDHLFRHLEWSEKRPFLSNKTSAQKRFFEILLVAHIFTIFCILNADSIFLNDILVTLLPSKVFKNSRKSTPCEKLNTKHTRIKLQVLYLTLRSIFCDET